MRQISTNAAVTNVTYEQCERPKKEMRYRYDIMKFKFTDCVTKLQLYCSFGLQQPHFATFKNPRILKKTRRLTDFSVRRIYSLSY